MATGGPGLNLTVKDRRRTKPLDRRWIELMSAERSELHSSRCGQHNAREELGAICRIESDLIEVAVRFTSVITAGRRKNAALTVSSQIV
jgi:hypothetical protein